MNTDQPTNITPLPFHEPSRIIQADARGNVKPPERPPEGAFIPFGKDVLFRYSPNAKKPGTFLLHDAAGQVVALCGSEQVADIMAKGAALFFQLAKAKLAEAQQKKETPVEEGKMT